MNMKITSERLKELSAAPWRVQQSETRELVALALAQQAEALRAVSEARSRRTDPRTSDLAAKSINLSHNREFLLHVMRGCGEGTDEEIARYYAATSAPKQSPSGLRSRRKELVRMGYVEDTGRTKKSAATGRLQKVWAAVQR